MKTARWILVFAALALGSDRTLAQTPQIDGLSHAAIERSGRLVVAGSGFSGAQGTVRIDGHLALVTSWADQRIVSYVPEAAGPGPVLVQVVTGAGPSNAVPLEVRLRRPTRRVAWRFALDSDYMIHRPAIAPDGTVYVNGIGGRLYALGRGGALKWIFDTGGQGAQGPVAVGPDGSVYVVGDPVGPEVHLFALDAAGTVRWIFTDANTQGVIAGPSVGPDGNVYLVTDIGGAGVVALSPAGQVLWTDTGNPTVQELGQIGAEIVFGPSQPGSPADQLYVAFDMGGAQPARLFAFGLQGGQRFSVQTGAQTDVFLQFQAQPAVGSQGELYLTSSRSPTGWLLERFDPLTGQVLWSYQGWPANGMSMPDIGQDGTAYMAHSLGHLVAVAPSGIEQWHFTDGTIVGGPVASPDGSLLLTGGRPAFGVPGFFRAFRSSGELHWQVDLGLENGGQLAPETRARFTPDGSRAYIGALILADDEENEYCYVYALDVQPLTLAPAR